MNAEDIKKTINKIIFTRATTKQWQLFSRQVLVEKASNHDYTTHHEPVDLNQHTSLPVTLRGKCVWDSERSAWQWFNMTVSLEWVLTPRHFHGQELVPVRASGHKAEGLATHSLEINTRRRADASRRAARKGVWFEGLKAARFLQQIQQPQPSTRGHIQHRLSFYGVFPSLLESHQAIRLFSIF